MDTLGTTSSYYLSNAFEACVKLGCNEHLLIDKIPGGHKALKNPAKRFKSAVLIDMLHYAEKLSGIVGFGALTGRFLRPSAMTDLGHAMVASSTLEDMIKMYRIYQPLLLQVGRTDVHKKGARAFLSWQAPEKVDAEYLRPYAEKYFGGVSTFGRWVTWDRNMEIIGMHFRHDAPSDLTTYRDVFKCPVYFNAAQDKMEVPRALVEHPMPQPNPDLIANIKLKMDRDLAELNLPVTAVREAFQVARHLLVNGAPNIAQVAEAIGTTERTLRRRLAEEGTSFRAVLENVRRETCKFELKRGARSMSELAKTLGYSDQSAFTRAFKSWYGMPPSKYMQVHYHKD